MIISYRGFVLAFSFFHVESFFNFFDWLEKASIESRPRLKKSL